LTDRDVAITKNSVKTDITHVSFKPIVLLHSVRATAKLLVFGS